MAKLVKDRPLIFILLLLFIPFLSTGTVQALTGNLSLTIADTSEPGSSETPNGSAGNERPVLIGEVVTYDLSFEIDEGVSSGVNVVVAIPNGLQYIPGSLGLSFNNDSGWGDTPTITGGASSGADMTFDFGAVNNTDLDTNAETITISFKVVVNNIATNQDGSILDLNAALNLNASPVDTSETRSVKVIEPNLILTKLQLDSFRGTPVTTGDAGDEIAYTVIIQNIGNAPAYNVDLSDFIPVTYVSRFGLYITEGLPSPTLNFDYSTGEWQATWPFINPGASVSATIRTRVNDTVRPADTWTNTANITYTSLPDDDGSDNNVPGTPGTVNGLRNGTDGNLNDYTKTDTPSSFSVPELLTVKQVEHSLNTPVATTVFPGGYNDSTSDPYTGTAENDTNEPSSNPQPDVDITIGETFSYIITWTFPEGVTAYFTPFDVSSPNGHTGGRQYRVIELLSAEVVHVGANLSGNGIYPVGYSSFTLIDQAGADGDADFTYFYRGDRNVTNTPDGVTNDQDRYIIRVTARLDDEDENDGAADAIAGMENRNGLIAGNRLQIYWKDSNETVFTHNLVEDIDIVEPNLTISKSTVSGSNLSPGDSAVFEITISNTGTAPAYNVVIVDQFPGVAIPYLAFGSVDSANSSCDDLGGFIINSGVPPIVTFSFDQLNAGSSCTIRFSAIVQNSVADNTTYTNSAKIDSYDSLDNNANADNRYYTGGSATSTFRTADTIPPTVTVPANITEEATSASGDVVNFSASANDNVDGTLTPTCSPASGSTFALGTTTVTCSATDNAGNTGSNSFTITVQDTTAPAVTVPANITQEATSASGNTITFTASATDIVDGSLTPTCVPASGSTFPLGTTTVTCSATDNAGNTGSNSFTVTVEDTTPPTVTVPANITEEATGASGATVTFGASASDIVDGSLIPSCSPASGSTFPLGTTTVTCSATDNAGNTGSNAFTVTVQDTTNPTVTVPADITQEATGASGAAVTFSVSASDAVDGSLSPTCDANSGDTFPLGTTTVTCSATDSAGNTGTNSFTITIEDTTDPTVTVPANITEEATSATGNVITFSASASDIVDGVLTPTCTPASGSTFPLGTTTVTCTATDNAGNTGSNSFTITVQDTTAPAVTIDQGATQPDPTNASPIVFDVAFSEDVTGFDNTDVAISGIAATPTITVTSTGTGDTYTVEVSGMADGETVTATISANAAQDASGNGNVASTSTDNSVTYDTSAISIITEGVIGQNGNFVIQDQGIYLTQFTSLEVTFNSDANNPAGSGDADDVTNPSNYLLIQSGLNRLYDTTSCLDVSNNGGAVLGDDIQIPTGPVTYDLITFTATLKLNNDTPLPYGEYRLFICGTTSITDIAGNPLNGGTDSVLTFTLEKPPRLPNTGFAPGQITPLPAQPTEKVYAATAMLLEIPSLDQKLTIVGVPLVDNDWDVTWLGNNAGYLAGTAFPTTEGNTVITGHVWNAYNNPGPFATLKTLQYGDRFYIHAWGVTYTYEVRESRRISSEYKNITTKHKDLDWVTLVTCEDFNTRSDTYSYRRVVRAVLVSVK